MMFKDMKIKGTPSKAGVYVSRKLTDGNWGSFEVVYGLEMNLAEGADLDAVFKAMDDELTLAVGVSAHEKEAKVMRSVTQPEAEDFVEPEYMPSTDATTKTILAETITVEFTPKGQKNAKVKGGRWKMYGVMCWPEVLSLPPIEWDLETLDAGDYPAPPGVKAIVLMDGDKPKKVIGWE